jgi:hypothetical protein
LRLVKKEILGIENEEKFESNEKDEFSLNKLK